MTDTPIRRKWYLIPGGCLAFILFFTVFGERGLLRIYELAKEQKKMEMKLAQTQASNQALVREIDALKKDRRYLETIARKELGLVHANEVIYQFPVSGGTAPQQTSHGR